MNQKVKKLLEEKGGNYILPFFWQHGEEEAVLREYMRVIHECGIGAVCVESRPHPDYCGPKWWRDMDIILEEAKKMNMKVWILDDSHFPTGYCNGAIKNGPDKLRRQSVTYKIVSETEGNETIVLNREEYENPNPFEPVGIEQYILKDAEQFEDDVLLGVIAVKVNGENEDDLVFLTEEQGKIIWTAPKGTWKIYACHLTRNRGPHRDYMNMLDKESCHKLIEAVYEPHYMHYKEEFGKTIAGFFSDEPEIGNGHMYETWKNMEDVEDQPWSREVEQELKKHWGDKWICYLPLLWEKSFHSDFKAKIRYTYMDIVTRCVEKNFSWQIGEWCRAHSVEYIGHIIEDNNQHSRCGCSLGHFFRGMAGEDMAGIDDIGGQVLPQGEDLKMHSFWGGKRDGVFFHYALGKLGSSAAAIEPLKNGRAMCEIFGNYGWAEGVQLEKYLADHFMVRGINHFVPHAFSAKDFPDPDCPPHFYAHGHNPQYRHFGKLMNYMNRICELINGGYHVPIAAILYHGEADWTGGRCMFSQEPARRLADSQIDYDFIPADVFAEEKFHTVLGKKLKVNTQEYQVLIVPETSYVTAEFAEAVIELQKNGFPVVFVDQFPKGICNGTSLQCKDSQNTKEHSLVKALHKCQCVDLEVLPEYLKTLNMVDITISPADSYIRYLHYRNGNDMYYFVNEGSKDYIGDIKIPQEGSCYAYNAWDNTIERIEVLQEKGETQISVCLEPRKSLILFFDEAEDELRSPVICRGIQTEWSQGWIRSICEALYYPAFKEEKKVNLPDRLEEELPKFGGFVRYEKNLWIESVKHMVLEISDAAEGVEVFVNGVSAGIQIVPVYRYDITSLLKKGSNQIVIEVATTLERAVPKKSRIPGECEAVPKNKCGINGTVCLWIEE